MNVFFSDIRDLLSPYVVFASIRDSWSIIRRVKLVSKGPVCPETLYFGTAADIDPEVPYKNIILMGDRKVAELLAADENCNLLVIGRIENWTNIFNAIVDSIESGQNAFYREMLAADGIAAILETGFQYMKRSLHLFDGALHAIGSHAANDAPLADRELSASIAAALKNDAALPARNSFAVTVRFTTYQCFKLPINDQVGGFLAIPCDNEAELDTTVIRMLFLSLSHALIEARSKPQPGDDFLRTLIACLANNRRMQPKEVALFLDRSGWKANDSYYLVKMVHMDHMADQLPLNTDLLLKEITGRISAKHIIYQNALYMVINCTRSGMLRHAAFEKRFKEILSDCRVMAAFSNRCKGFDSLFSCGFQLDISLHLGKLINPGLVVQPYSFYFHYEMLHMMSAYTDMSKYVHPAIRFLDEYDRVNKTDLVMTVYAYLNEDRNVQRAANYLAIHKNSMAYRLKKIHALTDFDLNEEFRTTHLRISCSIIKLQRIYHKSNSGPA